MTIDELSIKFDRFEEKNDDAHEQLYGKFDECSRDIGKLRSMVYLVVGVALGTGALEISKLVQAMGA